VGTSLHAIDVFLLPPPLLSSRTFPKQKLALATRTLWDLEGKRYQITSLEGLTISLHAKLLVDLPRLNL
jgi:hypothetical protein